MKKNITLYILLVFLIVVNGFFLFRHFDKPAHRKGGNPMSFVVNELDFNAGQMDQFRLLGEKHHKDMRHISDAIKQLKDELFSNISKLDVDRSKIDIITDKIGQFEKEKDLKMFYHFQAIQNICDSGQKRKFNQLIKDALHRDGNRPPPRRLN